MDSIGNIPIYISLLQGFPPKKQFYLILREMIIALVVIFIFYFLGNTLLELLNVKQDSVQIAGSIILFLIALKMIFPKPRDTKFDEEKEEPFIVPLAIPLVAGPSILATVVLYSYQEYSPWIISCAIVIAWTLSLIVLLSSTVIQKVLGKRGILACEKLMGLILTLIAIEMFLKGITVFFQRNS